MKNFTFYKTILLAVMLLLGSASAWAQTTVNYAMSSMGYAMSSMGLANGTIVGTSVRNTTDDKITFTFAQNSSTTAPTYYTIGTAVRLYQHATKGGSIKIMVASGYKITSATVTKASGDGDGPVGYAVDGGTEAGSFPDGTTPNTTGAINATSSVEFYSKGTSATTRFYVVSFSVTYEATASAPTITTPTSADVTSSSATLGGNITANGGASLTERGIYYSTTDGFADGAGTKVAGTGTDTGEFTVDVIGLDASTTYYFKAYATNSAGTGYSTQGTFATTAGGGGTTVPTLTSPTSASVTATSAVLGGTITSDGGDAITERGIYWSTTDGFADGAGTKVAGTGTATGAFTVSVSGLSYSTPYYYKAYAINGIETGYSAQGTFTTATPTLSSPGAKNFSDVERGSSSELKFTVSGTNLVANIGLELTGTNVGMFNLSSNSVASGTEITLTYSPTATGSHSATLTLSSTGASDVQISVTGTAINPILDTPVATDATSVNAFGFTANWDAVSNAESYSLQVYTRTIQPSPNILTNPGFEDGTTGWTFESAMNQAASTDQVKSGTYSLYSTVSATKKITQNITVESGVEYKISLWYYIDNSSTGNGFRVWTTTGATIYLPSSTGYYNTKGSWQYVEGTFTPTASSVTFEMRLYSGVKLYLDDISILKSADVMTETPISGSPFTVAANAKALTGLSPVSTYYYTVTASADGYTSSAVSNEKSVTTGKAYYRTADDGNWTSTSVWEYSADGVTWQATTTVPDDNAKEVAIAKTVTVPGASSVSAAKVTINPDSKLSIDGTLTVSDTITFVSTDAGTAQLLVNEGTVTNNGVIKIRKTLLKASNWYFVSFPFEVTAANVFKTDGTQASWGDLTDVGKDFYVAEYNGERRDATGSYATTNSENWASLATHTMLANKGYIIGAPADITLDFVSSESPVTTIFSTTASETLSEHTVNALDVHHSWNLAGIPFSSSFDLINATQAQAPFYYYDGTQYQTVMSDDNYQAYPFTSFFLQAKAGVNLEYATAGRLLKAAAVGNFDEVNLVVKNAKYSDKLRVRMQDGALEGYDMGKDAVKMFAPKAEVPQIFSKQNGLDLSVNALPFGVAKVNLKVKVGEEGTYTVSLDDVAKATDCKQVTLVDNATGKETDLLAGEAYSFAGVANTTKSFTLLLSSNKTALSVPELPGDVGGGGDPGDYEETALENGIENVSVYAVNRNIVVDASAGLVKSIGVYNVQGQTVAAISAASAYQVIPISTAGSYVVKLYTDAGVKVQKVLVK